MTTDEAIQAKIAEVRNGLLELRAASERIKGRCPDCQHYQLRRGSMKEFALCAHPLNAKTKLVVMTNELVQEPQYFARDCRRAGWLCGIEGNLFDPKPSWWERIRRRFVDRGIEIAA